MPEKVRVSPATASQLSTGSRQAALVPEEADELVELLDDEVELLDEDSDDLDVDVEDDDEESDDAAGTEPLPEDRLSVR